MSTLNEEELRKKLFGSAPVFEREVKKRSRKQRLEESSQRKKKAAVPSARVVADEKEQERPVPVAAAAEEEISNSNKNQKKNQKKQTKKAAAAAAVATVQGAAWEDPDDAKISIKIKTKEKAAGTVLRKTEGESVVTGREYERRLREEYKKMHASTKWADVSEKEKKGEDDSDDDDDTAFLQHAGSLATAPPSRLPPHLLEYQKYRDLNKSDVSKSAVSVVAFHPQTNNNLAIVAGLDKTLRIFQVDGKENPKVQSIFFDDLPITSAVFSQDGSEITLSGKRPFLYIYDIERGTIKKINQVVGRTDSNFKKLIAPPPHAAISNSNGNFSYFSSSAASSVILAPGSDGRISLLSSITRQRVGELRGSGGGLGGVAWNGGESVFSVSKTGVIDEWDLRTRRIVHSYRDTALFKPKSLAISANGQFLSCGSASGIVSIYDLHSLPPAETPSSSSSSVQRPGVFSALSAAKSLDSLTTCVTNLSFNGGDGQIMSMASNRKTNSLRLVHVPTFSVFSNFPRIKAPLEYVTSVTFSQNSGLMAVGNANGRVSLFRLKHYGNL